MIDYKVITIYIQDWVWVITIKKDWEAINMETNRVKIVITKIMKVGTAALNQPCIYFLNSGMSLMTNILKNIVKINNQLSKKMGKK